MLHKPSKQSASLVSDDLFYQHFPQAKERPILLVVIHAISVEQINIVKAVEAGVDGVFLINHGVPHKALLEWTEEIEKRHPTVWVGVNLLPLSSIAAVEAIPSKLFNFIKGFWSDDANIDEANPYSQPYPTRVIEKINQRQFPGLYFGGVSFKYKRVLGTADSGAATKIAKNYMHVVTTSGAGTGKAPDVDKIAVMTIAAGKTPLAIASGITPENIKNYLPLQVSCYLVATGVSDSFTELNYSKMKQLVDLIQGK